MRRHGHEVIHSTWHSIYGILGSWLYHIYCQELVIHEYCLEKDKERLNIKSMFSSEFESDPQISKLSAMCRLRAGVALEEFDRLTLFER